MSAKSSLLLIIPAILSFESAANYFDRSDVFNSDFFVIMFMALGLIVTGFFIKSRKEKADEVVRADRNLLIAGSIYAYYLIWNMISNGMYSDPEVAITVSLIIFTIVGLFKYFYGISSGSKVLRNYGGILLGSVVLRLLVIDVWNMDIAPRIVVFFLVGILLVSTAFISRKIKNKNVQ